MKDKIIIENLEVFANHGVLKEETSLGQKFLVSCNIYFDVSKAAVTDNIEDSVNYADVCAYITSFMRNNTFKLIERVADRIAKEVLLKYELIDAIEVTVKKPWAPIGLPVDCVMVTKDRAWHTAYVALGSNMGDTRGHIEYAIKELESDVNIKEIKSSKLITTKPYGYEQQDDFLNGVVRIKTLYEPIELLRRLQAIENDRGRTRTIHWGPRTLDLDILFFDDITMCTDELIIPHPDIKNRDFVLKPLCEIAPYYIHPVKSLSMIEMAKEAGFMD